MKETTEKTSWLKVFHEAFSGKEGTILLFLSLSVKHNFVGSQQSLSRKLGIDRFYLNKILKRLKDKGWIIVTDSEILLVPELANRWSRYHLACKNCLTASIRPRGGGLCRDCYYRKIVLPKREAFEKAQTMPITNTSRENSICTNCGLKDCRAGGFGFCKRCYQRFYRQKYRQAGRDKWIGKKGWKK